MTIKVKYNYSNSLSGNWKVRATEIHNWNCLKELVQWMGGWSHLAKLWRSGFCQKAKLFSKSLEGIYPKVFTHWKVLISRYVSKWNIIILWQCAWVVSRWTKSQTDSQTRTIWGSRHQRARQDIQKTSKGMVSKTSKRHNKEYEITNNKTHQGGFCRKPGTRLATAPHGLRRRRSRTWDSDLHLPVWTFPVFESFFVFILIFVFYVIECLFCQVV